MISKNCASLIVDGVEDVEGRREVDAVREAVGVGLVARALLVEHVELHLEVAVEVGGRRPDLLEHVHQLEADELIAHAVPVLMKSRHCFVNCHSEMQIVRQNLECTHDPKRIQSPKIWLVRVW